MILLEIEEDIYSILSASISSYPPFLRYKHYIKSSFWQATLTITDTTIRMISFATRNLKKNTHTYTQFVKQTRMNTKDERFHALLSTRTFLIVLRKQKGRII